MKQRVLADDNYIQHLGGFGPFKRKMVRTSTVKMSMSLLYFTSCGYSYIFVEITKRCLFLYISMTIIVETTEICLFLYISMRIAGETAKSWVFLRYICTGTLVKQLAPRAYG